MERRMRKARSIAELGILLIVALLLSLIYPANVTHVLADPAILAWSVINTPSSQNNVIVSPSEINTTAIGYDGLTFYAVDIPDFNSSGTHGRVHKSIDSGINWQDELSTQLTAAGALMPVWNIAMAPDNVNFVVAITDSTGGPVPGGPTQVYISTNGGAEWSVAVNGLSLNAGEYISCVDVSVTYGGTNRDIAVGTRDGAGAGRVFVMRAPSFGSWNPQDASPTANPPSVGWPAGGSDVVALKFSPTYPSDSSLVVVSSEALYTRLHIGFRDTAANFTNWDTLAGYPVQLRDANFAGTSPLATQIITADLELPSDFSGQDIGFCRFYVSTDVNIPTVQFGVYRVNYDIPRRINPQTSGRISSIAYSGGYGEGTLLAGEVTANPALGLVNVWRTSDPIASTPTWQLSDDSKSPTGGGNSGYANAQVAWNPDGTRAYCGTSSANPSVGGTGAIPGQWPFAWLTSFALDESAFSVSPYALAYSRLLTAFDKPQDSSIGNIWNQLSLIDTEMDSLNDVAALQAPRAGENVVIVDYDILYLFSRSDNMTVPVRFNSVWRSTSDPLGTTWERVFCLASDNVSILRVRQPAYDENDRSDVIVFATIANDIVGYSENEGQAWDVRPFTTVTDLALSSDSTIFILNDAVVHMYVREGTGWVFMKKVNTELDSGHTIAVPVKNPTKAANVYADMVVVGEAGLPSGTGRIWYADFSETIVKGSPPDSQRIPPPVTGDAHVIFDDKYDENGIIYNAIHDTTGPNGKIYRWVTGKSTAWDELGPPNAEFYGLVQRNSALYGAWRTPQVPAIITNNAGVDRTLYPRVNVPPIPEWDYLVAELPVAVFFNREPSSLKISSNDFNNLWVIDNRPYDFAASVGRLWGYTDILAKVGPWTTSPPSGTYIPVDPRSGRAVEVNFAWRQISYSTVYELQIAKDDTFYNRILVNENIVPADQRSPEVFFPAGGLIPASGSAIASWGNLESGHTYYWRVRARRAITGEIARSPWSATMYFTVEAGLPTASPYPTMTLFSPMYGAKNVPISPGFSWSKLPGITEYEFILAKDAALQEVIVKTTVPLTSYLYDGNLDYDASYFWQVRAIEPVVSDPSALGTFTVIAEPKPVTPITEEPTPIPSWVWWVIAVYVVLAVAMIVFTMVKPSYSRPGGGKLFKVEPIIEKPKETIIEKAKEPIIGKPKNPFPKIWESITTAIRRQRFLRKRSDSEPKDSKPEDSQEKSP